MKTEHRRLTNQLLRRTAHGARVPCGQPCTFKLARVRTCSKTRLVGFKFIAPDDGCRPVRRSGVNFAWKLIRVAGPLWTVRAGRASIRIWYAIENKDQMRPRLCILTTANHREINACTEKPENGVNGVKSGASLLTPLRYHPDPSSESPNRAGVDSDKGSPCHVQIQSPNTNIVHREVWRGSGRCWRIFTPTTSFRNGECVRSSRSSVSG